MPRIDSVLRPAGPVAADIAEMAWVLFIGGTLVFGVVMGVLWWSLRRRRGAAADRGRSTERWVVGGGVAFPVAVLSALLVYTAHRTSTLAPPDDPAGIVVTVKGHLWWWEVRYRDAGRDVDIVVANEIHVPVGRTVTFGLVSDDVIHSFWVPAIAGKVDLIPGRVHQLRARLDRPGTYRGPCAEFCGEQHARMVLEVVAEPPEAFERWLAAQARPAVMPSDAAARRGWQVFAAERCTACHAVRGLGPEAGIGPDLTHLASRARLAAGTLPLDRASLRAWVVDPQRIKPGVRMPSYDRLDEASLDALVTFLAQLR